MFKMVNVGQLLTEIFFGGMTNMKSKILSMMDATKKKARVKSYSTDGGKTWSTKAPEGVTVSDKTYKRPFVFG
jgi:Neuraminidase (sialidase)